MNRFFFLKNYLLKKKIYTYINLTIFKEKKNKKINSSNFI